MLERLVESNSNAIIYGTPSRGNTIMYVPSLGEGRPTKAALLPVRAVCVIIATVIKCVDDRFSFVVCRCQGVANVSHDPFVPAHYPHFSWPEIERFVSQTSDNPTSLFHWQANNTRQNAA